MRVAIYARFSSDLQDVRSITDQVGMARDRARRENWSVVAECADAAISGASLHNRPGLADLMHLADDGAIDAVLTESLDRLSRDLEDMAAIHKKLSFRNIKIITLADGEVGKMHVGIKGLIASLYLEDLAQKTRRGQVGRVKAGRIPGGRCYGYDVTDGADRGRRAINAAEAAIVRRIFDAYIAGHSPLAIAKQLNEEGVPGPRGGLWNASTMNGSRKRANGILSNTLYIGQLVYNRQRFIKDPSTGKRQARENPKSEWMTADLPELRIVDQATWDAAQARRAASGSQHLTHRRRPKRLLSGLIRCGVCGSSYIVKTRDYTGCSRRINTGMCDNAREVAMSEIETRVLDALRAHLLSPEAVAIAVEAYRQERQRLAREAAKDRGQTERALNEIERRIKRIVDAIETGNDPGPLMARLTELEAERRTLTRKLPPPDGRDVIALHPQAANRYREKVAAIHDALSRGDAAGVEAVALVRELVGEIRVIPAAKGEPVSLEIVGDLAALMGPENTAKSVTASVVAGARNSRRSDLREPVQFFLVA